MIRRQTGITPFKAEVIADMTGGVDGVQRPTLALDKLTIRNGLIRLEIDVDAFATPHQA